MLSTGSNMVIKKKVSKYKRGDSFGYRINISKTDNLSKDENIIILKNIEYKTLNDNITDCEKTINDSNHELKKTKNKLLSCNKTLNDFKKEINETNKRNGKLMVENTELLKQIKNIEKEFEQTIANQELELKEYEINSKNIEQIESIYKETLEKVANQQDKTMQELNEKYHNQLNEIYNNFKKDLEKYITVNQLQNAALKQILELGFIDLIRNKHKKIAKKQIKELDNDKKVYELTLKKE